MPYRVKGNAVYSKAGGKWHIKQRASSASNAKKTIRLLNAIEYGGWKPTKNRKKKR